LNTKAQLITRKSDRPTFTSKKLIVNANDAGLLCARSVKSNQRGVWKNGNYDSRTTPPYAVPVLRLPMNNDYPFISASQMAEGLGITRQRVHQIIRAQGMDTSKFGSLTVVDKKDYALYLKRRLRRDLAKNAGRLEMKLIKTAVHDTTCSLCGSFAVNWKGTIACKEGHISKGENSNGRITE